MVYLCNRCHLSLKRGTFDTCSMMNSESIVLKERRPPQRANPVIWFIGWANSQRQKADSGLSGAGKGRELLLNGAVSLRVDKKLLETVGMVASHCGCVGATELQLAQLKWQLL